MFALLPMWIKIIFFLVTNGASIIAILRELRLLLKDLNSSDQKALFELCKEDFDAFKDHKDETRLMSAITEKKIKFKTMEGSVKGRGRRARK